MKVTISWGSKNEDRMKIDADTLESVHRRLDVLPEWGHFKWSFGDYSVDDDDHATEVVIRPTYTIKMPVWTKCPNQPKSCQAEWNRMWKALRVHEEGHRAIFLKGLANLEAKLKALKGATFVQVTKMVDKANSDIVAQEKTYDNNTKHGASRGVDLKIAKECSDSP